MRTFTNFLFHFEKEIVVPGWFVLFFFFGCRLIKVDYFFQRLIKRGKETA